LTSILSTYQEVKHGIGQCFMLQTAAAAVDPCTAKE
jgi:hypothetical protein